MYTLKYYTVNRKYLFNKFYNICVYHINHQIHAGIALGTPSMQCLKIMNLCESYV